MSSLFELQPTLNGALISIEPMKISDFDALYQAASDPKIWEQHPVPLRYKREVFQSFLDSAMESKGAFTVRELSTGTVIGSSRYYDFDQAKNCIVIGFTFLSCAYWDGLYNRELKTLMINHAFKFVDAVHFHIGSQNRRSQIAMERIGGIKVDELTMSYPPATTVLNYVYEIRRENWL